jgi:hypothetical protein
MLKDARASSVAVWRRSLWKHSRCGNRPNSEPDLVPEPQEAASEPLSSSEGIPHLSLLITFDPTRFEHA